MMKTDISIDEFAQIVIDQIHEVSPGTEVEYKRDTSEIVVVSEQHRRFYLNNAYRECKLLSDRDRHCAIACKIELFLGKICMPDTFEHAKDCIVPRIYPRSITPGNGSDIHDFVQKPFSEHLVMALVYEAPTAFIGITDSIMSTHWGVGRDECFAVAEQNLIQIADGNVPREPFPGLYVWDGMSSHNAALLILTDMVRNLNVQGTPVAMVPHQNAFIVTGSDSHLGLSQMLTMAQDSSDLPHTLSPFPLILTDAGWKTYHPPENHLLYDSFHRNYIMGMAGLYEHQAQQMKKMDRPAAVYMPAKLLNNEESPVSISIWIEGISESIPDADAVLLVGYKQKPRVPYCWCDVRDVMGSKISVEDVYPRRYRVPAFPNKRDLRKLDKSLTESIKEEKA